MSHKAELDDFYKKEAVKQLQSETPGCSSSSSSASYKGKSREVYFQVILQEESEEFLLMDDWMIIESSSNEDDEPSEQRELMLEAKGAAHTSVSYSNQVEVSPVLNPTVNETVHTEKENETNLNLYDRMKDHLPLSQPIEIPAYPSFNNSSEYSTAITSSNCTTVVLCKETEDSIPSEDRKQQIADTQSTCSSESVKNRDDLCSSSSVSERWRNSEEIEVVDMIESMPNRKVSHKFSSSVKGVAFCKPCGFVKSQVSGSYAPKNLSSTETFHASLKQTSDGDSTCIPSQELKFNKHVITPIDERTLRSECAADRKKRVSLKLLDKSKKKMSRAIENKDALELSKGDTQKTLEHQTEFTHIPDTSHVVTVEKAKEVGRKIKEKSIYSNAKIENKNTTLESDLLSRMSNVSDHQQPSVSYKINNHLPSYQNSLERHQLLPKSHEDDHHQLFTSKQVNDQQHPNMPMNGNFKKLSVVQRLGEHNHPLNVFRKENQHQLSLRRPSDHYQSSDFCYYENQYSSHSAEGEEQQWSSDLDKLDNHQGQEIQAKHFVKRKVFVKTASNKTPSGKLSLQGSLSEKLSEQISSSVAVVKQWSSVNISEEIPTTMCQVEENFETAETDNWKKPKNACKKQNVNYFDDVLTRDKIVNPNKKILSSTDSRTLNLDISGISSWQHNMEPSENTSSELIISRIKTSSESNTHNKEKESQEEIELNVSSNLDTIPKFYQAAAISKELDFSQGSRKELLKAKEYTPSFKKIRMNPNKYVHRPFVDHSIPVSDYKVANNVLSKDKILLKLSEPLISSVKNSDIARVGGCNKGDSGKYSENSFVTECLEVISKVNSSLGSLGPAVEHLLVQSTLVSGEGKDPLELFLIKDNITMLKLVSQQLFSQIEGNQLLPDLTSNIVKALKMTDQLLKEANQFKAKEKCIELDIDALARATYGDTTCKIIAFIQNTLKCQGIREIKEKDLYDIFMAIASKHLKLMAEIEVNYFKSTFADKHDFGAKSSKTCNNSSQI